MYVGEGDRLFEVVDLSVVWLEIDLYERDLAWVKVGQAVTAKLPSAPGLLFEGKIERIEPAIGGESRAARGRVALENPAAEGGGRRLVPGAYAEVEVAVETPEALRVPRSAIIDKGGGARVYLDRGEGQYEPRVVRLGRAGDEAWEIVGGLAEGDRVVVAANLLIDAQAELNSGGGAELPGAAWPEAASPAVIALAGASDAMVRALASDDLAAFGAASAHVEHLAAGVASALEGDPAWSGRGRELAGAAGIGAAGDLAAARKALHRFSEPFAGLVLAGRRAGAQLGGAVVFGCPMTSGAFPGAPEEMRWVQKGEPLANPYAGPSMRDCGSEVAP
jgi:hypothetical protein